MHENLSFDIESHVDALSALAQARDYGSLLPLTHLARPLVTYCTTCTQMSNENSNCLPRFRSGPVEGLF